MPDLILDDCIRLHALRNPKKIAVGFGNETIDYLELDDRVNRIGNALLSLGISKGDNVAVLSYNKTTALEVCFGLARIGCPYVPINYRLSAREMVEYAVRMNCRAWIFGFEFEKTLLQIMPKLKNTGVKHFVMFGGEGLPDGMLSYEDLLVTADSAKPEVKVDESDCFWIMATGGTTGESKGVMKSHREWVLSLLFHAIEHGVNEDDKTLAVAPLCYGAGAYTAQMTLYVGGTVYIIDQFEPEKVLFEIQRKGITAVFMVPTMYSQIVSLSKDVTAKYDLKSVKTLISAGSPLMTNTKNAILNLFPHAGLHEYYGASDLSIVSNLRPHDQIRKVRSVGKPVLGMEVRLLDDEGLPVNPGDVGELYVRGHCLPMGYYEGNRGFVKASNAEWLTAGDLARMDEEGYYYIVDRKKDMIISGGINIYPAEVEEVLSEHPDVLEVAVVGIPSEKWGEEVKAFVVRKASSRLQGEDLLAHCEEKLARYKIPKSVSFLEELPKSTAGKILKRYLREDL